MKLYKFSIVMLVLSVISNQMISGPPSTIYYGKRGVWWVYYDSRKEFVVVELGGIKYGFLDIMQKTDEKDTIGRSQNGVLFWSNNELYYKNFDLNVKIKLEIKKYDQRMDSNRYKIFEISEKQNRSKLYYLDCKDDLLSSFKVFRDSVNLINISD